MGPFEFSPWGGPTATWILVQAPLGNIIRKDETLRVKDCRTSTILFTIRPSVVTRYGICLGNKKVNPSQVFAG
jgi:hypothetical protein